MTTSIFTGRHWRRAFTDIVENRFISAITIVTIGLAVLILGIFALFVVNAEDVILSWKKGLRIMAYTRRTPSGERVAQMENMISAMPHVASVRFIPKSHALESLRKQLAHQAGIFDHLNSNPLPDAFDIRMTPAADSWRRIGALADAVAALPEISDVEYGREWIGKFSTALNLVRGAGVAMGIIFFLVMGFIVSNTIRLAMFSRREEVEIMRLVGASDSFIKAPFYLQAMIQGMVGGVIGLSMVFMLYLAFCTNMDQAVSGSALFHIRFLPAWFCLGIVAVSILAGWVGCRISIKQFLRF